MSYRSNLMSHCKRCGARGVWMADGRRGRKVLVEWNTVTDADVVLVFDPQRHVDHAERCPAKRRVHAKKNLRQG